MRLRFWLLLSSLAVGSLLISRPVQGAQVVKGSFLTTSRSIKTANGPKTVKLTIPKKTTTLVAGIKYVHGKKYVSLNLNRLHYQLRKPLLTSQNHSRVSHWILATGKNFKKATEPTYLKYYSLTRHYPTQQLRTYIASGDLWLGQSLPADYDQVTGTRVTITTDGYLEFFKQSAYHYQVSPKPNQLLKIQKSVLNQKSRQLRLYFKTRLSTLPMTKVAAKGANRYRLIITRTGETTATAIPNSDQATQVILNEIYQLGKTTYYMAIESARFLGGNES
ncbi:hypothetical protein ACFQ22_04375 [Lentilactobacillus raoultii]|uniref:Uncharacterized protein n=1 Tax=Lentilactobacillus raoultii TaxID=1987503 RepID=A0ABW3PG17_9LACO|nr:hypothetical protein [Lentilactobacillus raoultii]